MPLHWHKIGFVKTNPRIPSNLYVGFKSVSLLTEFDIHYTRLHYKFVTYKQLFLLQVVNVYRLISKNTVEEKILGLQQFKLKTANSVISSENSATQVCSPDN